MAATGNILLKSPGTSWDEYWLLWRTRFQPQVLHQPTWNLANDSLSELQFPHFSKDVITRLSLKVHSSIFYQPARECPLHTTCTQTMLPPSGGYGNVSLDAMWGKAVPWHKPNVLLGWRAGGDVCQPNGMGSAVHGNSQGFGDVGSFFVGFYT